MILFVKPTDRKLIMIEINNDLTIREIKKKIQEKLGIDPEEQKLIFQGSILDDTKTVSEYQICDKSEIDLVELK